MSKCGVLRTWNCSDLYWTLFDPKCCPEAASGRRATDATTPARQTARIDRPIDSHGAASVAGGLCHSGTCLQRNKLVFDRPSNQLRGRMHVEQLHQPVLDCLHSASRHVERLGDLLCPLPLHHQTQHSALLRR